uniref:hypothetical protein n=1 Tax=uncultured Duncaniella sp. TaxID=2768039 RepID=UPI0025B45D10
ATNLTLFSKFMHRVFGLTRIELIAEFAERSCLFTIASRQQDDEQAQTEERFTLLHILLIFGLFQ